MGQVNCHCAKEFDKDNIILTNEDTLSRSLTPRFSFTEFDLPWIYVLVVQRAMKGYIERKKHWGNEFKPRSVVVAGLYNNLGAFDVKKFGGSEHEFAKRLWSDGSFYEGSWIGGKANGWGRLIHSKGDVYVGQWVDDKAEGHGTYTHADGTIYIGQWQADEQHGEGREIWPDGACFEGTFVDNMKVGVGRFDWADGNMYEGEFYNNEIEGHGTYSWSDGRVFTGQWAANQMQGAGVFTWPDGRLYKGEYQNDKKHGFGLFQWPDGRKYEGNWENGKQHGKGVFTSAGGTVKTGCWEFGKMAKQMLILPSIQSKRHYPESYKTSMPFSTSNTPFPVISKQNSPDISRICDSSKIQSQHASLEMTNRSSTFTSKFYHQSQSPSSRSNHHRHTSLSIVESKLRAKRQKYKATLNRLKRTSEKLSDVRKRAQSTQLEATLYKQAVKQWYAASTIQKQWRRFKKYQQKQFQLQRLTVCAVKIQNAWLLHKQRTEETSELLKLIESSKPILKSVMRGFLVRRRGLIAQARMNSMFHYFSDLKLKIETEAQIVIAKNERGRQTRNKTQHLFAEKVKISWRNKFKSASLENCDECVVDLDMEAPVEIIKKKKPVPSRRKFGSVMVPFIYRANPRGKRVSTRIIKATTKLQ